MYIHPCLPALGGNTHAHTRACSGVLTTSHLFIVQGNYADRVLKIGPEAQRLEKKELEKPSTTLLRMTRSSATTPQTTAVWMICLDSLLPLFLQII